jgi:EpsD family peptidyl-prolyl cis-trans isomerase
MKSCHVRLIAATFLMSVLSGCEQPPSASQQAIVAKVGDAAISQAELNLAVSRLGTLDEADATQARSKVLEALIEQQLLSNAARSAKLDRDPRVVLALQQAQRQVLSDAFMEHLFSVVAKPSDTEIHDYFSRHPELFSARRIYHIQELQLRMDSKRLPEVAAQLKQSHTLADFAAWLKAQGIEGKGGQVVKSAEQVPAVFLAQLKRMQDGQTVVLATGPQRISVLQLQSSEVQPVTLEQASAAIEQLLLSEKRKTLLEAELKKLRSSGKIEYATGFVPAQPVTQGGKASDTPARP